VKKNNYKEAFAAYSKAAALKADNAAYQAGCGAAYYHLGDYKNSCDFFAKAAALSSGKREETVQFMAARGAAFFALAKFSEAAASFTQAITEAASTASAELYNARAACYQKLNIGDKTANDLKSAAKAPKTSGVKIRGVPLPEAKK
jgi:tetratricopeptide (TPR) repeat protein